MDILRCVDSISLSEYSYYVLLEHFLVPSRPSHLSLIKFYVKFVVSSKRDILIFISYSLHMYTCSIHDTFKIRLKTDILHLMKCTYIPAKN